MAKKPHGWYKEITIRPVVAVDGYEAYEKVCSYVAEVFFSTNERELRQKLITNRQESIYTTAYTLYKVGEAKCPAYWVGKDLLTALMQSEIDIEIENLNWAMKTGIFMLPQGTVFSPANDSLSAIYWHYNDVDKLLFWTAIDKKNSFCRQIKVNSNLTKNIYVDIEDIKDYKPQVISEFNNYIQDILLRLILVMGCRPELIEQEDAVVKVNKGFAKDKVIDLYQPIWIGRSYSIKRDRDTQDQGGTHANRRVHWRKGFLRNQPYGQGRQQRKLIWIEPVLVMGGS
jgi:hypothetical protein